MTSAACVGREFSRYVVIDSSALVHVMWRVCCGGSCRFAGLGPLCGEAYGPKRRYRFINLSIVWFSLTVLYAVQVQDLTRAVEMHTGQGKGGGIDWGGVSRQLGSTRTPNQCHTRWLAELKQGGDSGSAGEWTDAEDVRLTEAVAMLEGRRCMDWRKV